MPKYIQPFACRICEGFIEGKTPEDHKKECKGPPEKTIVEPEPIPSPIVESLPDSKALSQVERNRRYRKDNEEYQRKHRQYMKEYMRRKRKEAR